jgi:hypothetical protein
MLYFPGTPTFPHFGLLGMLGYLPAKFKLRFLEPISFDEEGLHEDKALVQTVSHEIRARIQENLDDMLVAHRQLGLALNVINRELCLLDPVPEVLAPPVVDKLRFVHELIRSAGNAGATTPDRLARASAE